MRGDLRTCPISIGKRWLPESVVYCISRPDFPTTLRDENYEIANPYGRQKCECAGTQGII